MKGILTSYKINEKYLPAILWVAVACIIFIAYRKFPLSSTSVGDEMYYKQEVDFLAKYGLYNSLSQGTSVFMSCLIFLCSKLFFTNFLIGARILSVIAFVISCRLFYKCTGRFHGMSVTARHMAVLALSAACFGWLWKGIADVVSLPFFLATFYFVTGKWDNRNMVIAAVLTFLGFAVKPTILMTIPGIALAILLIGYQQQGWKEGFMKSFLFGAVFLVCFAVYHIPGYRVYHKLMLETKDHLYTGMQRVETKNLWYERIVYFEQYNVNHKPNKWLVTWGELDTFKATYPDIQLNVSFAGYIKKYTGSYVKGVVSKIFLTLPYSIQYGFFFAKWTVANKFIHNYFIIKVLTLLLISAMFFVEREFIKKNFILLLVPFCYYLLLSVYVLSELEDNWLLLCLPMLALPVAKFLADRVNILALVGLQVVYLLL